MEYAVTAQNLEAGIRSAKKQLKYWIKGLKGFAIGWRDHRGRRG
jgi:hypothetical protein